MTSHHGKNPARVTFAEELRGRWPTKEVIAESRVDGQPWSIRLRLWSPPDETGTCVAWAETLRPEAPIPTDVPIELRLGTTIIGRCVLAGAVTPVDTGLRELDFLDPEHQRGVRDAA